MRTEIQQISLREVLHFLGWHGSPLEPQWISTLHALCERVKKEVHPRVIFRRFPIESGGRLQGTNWAARGEDARAWLASCEETVLFAATLGAESERMLLREQAVSAEGALLLDAVLSAAIESVCDDAENQLRREAEASGKYLTDRFSPGYGDFSIEHQRDIARELDTARRLGLTVTESLMLAPMKSVTAVIGVSRREGCTASGCAACGKTDCEFRRQ